MMNYNTFNTDIMIKTIKIIKMIKTIIIIITIKVKCKTII